MLIRYSEDIEDDRARWRIGIERICGRVNGESERVRVARNNIDRVNGKSERVSVVFIPLYFTFYVVKLKIMFLFFSINLFIYVLFQILVDSNFRERF